MKKINYLILILLLCVLIYVLNLYFTINIIEDDSFTSLIKEMAEKNHNNSSLFIENYNKALTLEEKRKVMITNEFYECIYKNKEHIHTKFHVNSFCGHFIRF